MKKIIEKAIALVHSAILEFLSKDELVWGPRWVSIVVMAEAYNIIHQTVGPVVEWEEEWGPKADFRGIAYKKADLVKKRGKSTAQIVNQYPWQLRDKDFPWAGGVGDQYLSVGVSGAREETDEMIAKLVLCTIQGLCKLYMKEIKNKMSD